VEKIIKYSLFLRQCKVYQPAQNERKKGEKKQNTFPDICASMLFFVERATEVKLDVNTLIGPAKPLVSSMCKGSNLMQSLRDREKLITIRK
jgi:hypothetical protein